MRNIIVLAALLLCAAGQAQTVDICDRTVQVRSAIMDRLNADDCSAVEGLASLSQLGTYNLRALQAGDFDGLTSLRFLYLYGNLTALPAGVFDGLASLEYLNLSGNQLTTLPAGVFEGLTSLQRLRLH